MIRKKSSSAWREIGGIRKYYRSMWEANYARYLQFLKERNQISDWFHEPKTFWFEDIKRGVRSYKPDFQVIDNNGETVWYEVKGFYDDKSKTKIRRFKKYYPDENLYLIDSLWFASNGSNLKMLIPDWEVGEKPFSKFQAMAKKKYMNF
jgi:hypothetical protein